VGTGGSDGRWHRISTRPHPEATDDKQPGYNRNVNMPVQILYGLRKGMDSGIFIVNDDIRTVSYVTVPYGQCCQRFPMSNTKSAYTSGRIVRLIDQVFGLTGPCIIDCANAPHLLTVLLRHVWAEAKEHPIIGDLIRGWTPAPSPLEAIDVKALFWQGFYARLR
jgi:hypothetical protein